MYFKQRITGIFKKLGEISNVMIQKTIIAAVGTALFMSVSAIAAEGWMTDFEAAKKKAIAENKALLVDFTGSDWCVWCIKLDEEVFQKPEFKGAEKFVLVSLDFPRDNSKQSPELIEQNNKLKEQFGVRGFPSIYLMGPDLKPFAKTGYQQGGPENYNAHLDELLEGKETLDAAFAAAKSAETPAEKVKHYETALQSLSGVSASEIYPEVVAEILEADPKNAVANKDKLMRKLGSLSTKAEFENAPKGLMHFLKNIKLKVKNVRSC